MLDFLKPVADTLGLSLEISAVLCGSVALVTLLIVIN